MWENTAVSSDYCCTTDSLVSLVLAAVAGVMAVWVNIAVRLESAWLQQQTGSQSETRAFHLQ